MITMKDVAQRAGVSVSTVSNIVNGVKSVNSEIVKKVEIAMNELGYIPNAKAQGLRSKKSNTIGVVIPDINDNIYSDILLGIENAASFADYTIQLYITGDIPELEITALTKLQNQQAEAIIISSCMPTDIKYIQTLINKHIKVVFIRRKPLDFVEGSFVGIDEYSSIYNCIEYLSNNKIHSASLITLDANYSNENDSQRAFHDGCTKFGLTIVNIANLKLGKEQSFKTTSWWMQSDKIPDVIITTNPKSKDGINAAINFFTNYKRPTIIATDSSSWTIDINENIYDILTQNFYKLGMVACNKALDLINSPNKLSNESIILPCKTLHKKVDFPILKRSQIKVLLLENSTSYATSILASKFSQNTNLDIEITTTTKMQNHNIDDFDILQIHQPFIKTLIQHDKIICLNNTILPEQLNQNFSNDVLQIYAKNNKDYYAVPYIGDCQLLYYRKDLFDSMHLQRLYYETYKYDLSPPTSFKEYNQIAKFFTKEFNPDSPIEYGNIASGDTSSLVFNFFPRLWELLGYKTNNFSGVVNGMIKVVLTNLKETFRYSNKATIKFNQKQQIESLNNGSSAMMVSCQTVYLDYVNSQFTSSNEKIYSTIIPNKYSVRTGYSLAIHKNSNLKEECISFFNWFLSDSVSLSNNLLGGTIPSSYVIQSNELSLSNPWLNITCENIKHSVDILNYNIGNSYSLYEVTLGKILQDFVNNIITIEQATIDIYNLLNTY
ncbi:MAG: extracellular solute-binding protein [Eubacteriales bacterium]